MKQLEKEKGFTLIELLAVIVILAIIALIATPIVMNITKDAKKNASLRGSENYIKEVESTVISSKINRDNSIKDGTYTIKNDGNLCIGTLSNCDDPIEIKMNGTKPTTGLVNIKNGVVIRAELYINGISIDYNGNDLSESATDYSDIVYSELQTLKSIIENKEEQIAKNVVTNGQNVNKVVGIKGTVISNGKETSMNNYVWFSGQLWQVIETNDNTNSIKMVTANSLTSIAYGQTNDWNTSWVRKWLNEIDSNDSSDGVFYNSLERKELIKDTEFCIDKIDSLPSQYTKMNNCINKVYEKVGLITYEDYIYAKDGIFIQDGGSFLDETELSWIITPTNSETSKLWHTNSTSTSNLLLTSYYTNSSAIGVRPVISIDDSVIVKEGTGTKANPYILAEERKVISNSNIGKAKVGDYIYIDESNSGLQITSELISNNLRLNTQNGKARYRVIKINDDGTVKLERAALLAISNYVVNYLPFYSIDTGDSTTSCYYDVNKKYDTTVKIYSNGCTGHVLFNPNDQTGNNGYQKDTGDSLAYYLNSEFYNWYSDEVKEIIIPSIWNLYTGGWNRDYSKLNSSPNASYPAKTNDGNVTANVGLPTWGEIYSGNDLNYSYWYINRKAQTSTNISIVGSSGIGDGDTINNVYKGIRPVISIKSNVKIIDGSGTMNDPYILNT